MSKHATEARLLKALAVEIEELETLEKFRLDDEPQAVRTNPLMQRVYIVFETPFARNEGTVRARMERAIAQTIVETAPELVANAIAVQRGIVEQKRQELADFQTKPLPPPADEGDLDIDNAKGFDGERGESGAGDAATSGHQPALADSDVEF